MKIQDNTKVVPVVIEYTTKMVFRSNVMMDEELLEDYEMGKIKPDINLVKNIQPNFLIPDDCVEDFIDEDEIEVLDSSNLTSQDVKPFVILKDGDSFKIERIGNS